MAVTRRTRVTEDASVEETPAVEETPRAGGIKRTPGRKLSAWSAVVTPREKDSSTTTYEKSESVPYVSFNGTPGTKYLKGVHAGPQDERKQHYVASLRKFFFCYNSDNEQNVPGACELCDAGHKSKWVFRFNVVEMNDDPTVVKTWDLNWTASGQLISLAAEELGVSPEDVDLSDPDLYWKVVYSKEGQRGSTTFFPVDARSIEKKNMVPLDEDAIAELAEKEYGRETVFKFGHKFLGDAAEKLTPGDLK